MADVTQTVQVAARVPSDLLARVEAVADADDRTVSYVIRQALVAYVQRAEQTDAVA